MDKSFVSPWEKKYNSMSLVRVDKLHSAQWTLEEQTVKTNNNTTILTILVEPHVNLVSFNVFYWSFLEFCI